MKLRSLSFLAASLILVACADTTGLTPDLKRGPSPESNPNAVVTVVEYGDIQCPACKTSYELVVKPLLKQYGSKIRFEFHEMPLSSIHSYALPAAEAAECAADQGKFWQFLDLAYAEQDKLPKEPYADWAVRLGLDTELFHRCRTSHIKRKAIKAEYEEAVQKGVGGTPTYFVNGQEVEGTVEALSTAIDQAITNIGNNL